MYSLLSPYLGQLTCGMDIDLSPYNVENVVPSKSVMSSERPDIDNMEVTPLHISIKDLRETNNRVYVDFKITENEVTLTEQQISTPTCCVWRFDESQNTHPIPQTWSQDRKHATIQSCSWLCQIPKVWCSCNHAVWLWRIHYQLFSLLWDIDSHYYKLKSRYHSFPNVVEQKFLNFNKLQSHQHKPKQLSIQTLSLKIDKLRTHLDRGYMNGTHMTLLRNIVKGICDSLNKYVDYLKKQAVEVSKNHKTANLPESKIDNFKII